MYGPGQSRNSTRPEDFEVSGRKMITSLAGLLSTILTRRIEALPGIRAIGATRRRSVGRSNTEKSFWQIAISDTGVSPWLGDVETPTPAIVVADLPPIEPK